MKKTRIARGLRIIAILSMMTSLVFFGMGNTKVTESPGGGCPGGCRDVCNNIDGVQTSPPPGTHEKWGDCHCNLGYEWVDSPPSEAGCALPPVDVCNNIDGVQTSPPPGTHEKWGDCVCDHRLNWVDGSPSVSGCRNCQVIPINVGICHANYGNGWVSESPSADASGLHGGHHPLDIIPAFTVEDDCGNTVYDYAGKNMGTNYGGYSGAQVLSNGCKIPVCGDGVKDFDEQCDGNDGVGQYQWCDGSCKLHSPVCGNGVIEAPEECDGSVLPAGAPEGSWCDSCKLYSPVCGNGVIEIPEECDGSVLPVGVPEGSWCDSCKLHSPVCGNDVIEFPEECDNMTFPIGTDENAWCESCVIHIPVCGNDIIEPSEQCDGLTLPSDAPSGAWCDSCVLYIPTCGDGIVQAQIGEQCDDGNILNGDGCSSICTVEAPKLCGNGTLDPGESCDDGNNINGDGCNASCATEVPVTYLAPPIIPVTGAGGPTEELLIPVTGVDLASQVQAKYLAISKISLFVGLGCLGISFGIDGLPRKKKE